MSWFLVILSLPTFIFYLVRCLEKGRQYDLASLPGRILTTRNWFKRYVYWSILAESSPNEAQKIRWFSLTVMSTSIFIALTINGSYQTVLLDRGSWLVAVLLMLAYLSFSFTIGLMAFGIIICSLPKLPHNNLPEAEQVKREVDNQKPSEA